MERFKCNVTLGYEPAIFKRYGNTETEVKSELEQFLKDRYDMTFRINSIDKDKTHTLENGDN